MKNKFAIRIGSILVCLVMLCGILPGLIFLFMKIEAANYFRTLQQKIQAEVSGVLAETRFQTGDAARVASTLTG